MARALSEIELRRLSSEREEISEKISQQKTTRVVEGPENRVCRRALIVPGAFFREYPQHGARGERVARALEKLGIEVSLLPLPSFCSISESANQLEAWLREDQSNEPLALISLSKGGADVTYFLNRSLVSGASEIHSKIACWISFSGICFGSAIVEETLRNPLRKLLIKLIFLLRGYSFPALLELGSTGPLQQATLDEKCLPFPCLHFVGFPDYRALRSPLSRKSVFRLRHLGASDGGGFLLRDCFRLPGAVVPLSENDHYLAEVDEGRLLALALSHLGLRAP